VYDTRAEAIALLTADGARVERFTVSNITVRNLKGAAIAIRMGVRNRPYRQNAKINPKFYEVARQIVEITEGKAIVAHNARFDYSFLRQEFKSLGFNFKRNLIDTVSACRKLIPGYPSYSLGNICGELGIKIEGRHRAAGDALATVKLFELLIERDAEINGPADSIFRSTRDIKLNPALDLSRIEEVPEEPGVYYFYDEKNELIYVGKSRNLAERVATHLSNNATRRSMEMRDRIASIDWECTGSELLALLKESEEIKRNKPIYNRAQRRTGSVWGLFRSINTDGYITFRTDNVNCDEIPLATYASKPKARAAMQLLIEKYRLCQKMCGLYDTEGSCFHFQVGICSGACNGSESPEVYNARASKVVDEFNFGQRNCLIIDTGRNREERSVVKIVNGKYIGYGWFSVNDVGFGLGPVHDCIAPAADNRDVQMIIRSYLERNRVERIIDF
ncbi:MAG: exonuclease domain-containing protein, partial [Bacteroidales bacterium]